jgi:hypothetical protein
MTKSQPSFYGKQIKIENKDFKNEIITLTETEKKLAKRLLELAKQKQLTSYSTEASMLEKPMLARHPSYCRMLDRINRYSYQKYGLFLAAIVKHHSSDTIGLGFFVAVCDCINLSKPEDKMDLKQNWSYYHKFWKDELEKLFNQAHKIEIE